MFYLAGPPISERMTEHPSNDARQGFVESHNHSHNRQHKAAAKDRRRTSKVETEKFPNRGSNPGLDGESVLF